MMEKDKNWVFLLVGVVFILVSVLFYFIAMPPLHKTGMVQARVVATESCTCESSSGSNHNKSNNRHHKSKQSGKKAVYEFEHNGMKYRDTESGCTCGAFSPSVGGTRTVLYNKTRPSDNTTLMTPILMLIFLVIGVGLTVTYIHIKKSEDLS